MVNSRFKKKNRNKLIYLNKMNTKGNFISIFTFNNYYFIFVFL